MRTVPDSAGHHQPCPSKHKKQTMPLGKHQSEQGTPKTPAQPSLEIKSKTDAASLALWLSEGNRSN